MENALGRDRVETAGPGGGQRTWQEAMGHGEGDLGWKTTFNQGRSLLIGIPEALFCGL